MSQTAVTLSGRPARWQALHATTKAAGNNPQLTVSIFVIVLATAAIAGAHFLTPAGPNAQDVAHRLLSPSWAHPFGTDELGRDVFTRVLYGGRISLPAAFIVVLCGASVGALLGAIAGTGGRLIDEVLMRATDVVMSFPVLVLAMAVAAALGPSLAHGVISLSLVWWPPYMRVTRGMILELREKEYVAAAKAAGRSAPAVLIRVILPNVVPALSVMAAVDVGRAILAFSVLSFLGLGERPPAPEWGSMVASGVQVMDQWWVATAPGLAILVIVFAFNLLGDSVGDAMNPWIGGQR